MGVGYWGFTGHARHKSVASLAYFDWTLVHMSHHDGQLGGGHGRGGGGAGGGGHERSYICLTMIISWEEDKDEKITF